MKDKLYRYIVILIILVFNIGCGNNNQIKVQEQQAEINNNDFTKENSLHDAVRVENIELIKLLLKKNIDINKQNRYGYTPLHIAVRLNNLDIIELLIKHHANINTRDIYHDTPLLEAVRNNNTDTAKVLICDGAYRNVKDKNGISTLNYSTQNNNQLLTSMLTAKDLDPFCKVEDDSSIIGDGFNVMDDSNSTDDQNITDMNDTVEEFDPMASDMMDTNATNTEAELEKLNLKIEKEIYAALMEEFKDDFKKWGSYIDKDKLVFEFNKNDVLYSPLQTDINKPLKNILTKFFPRYIDILLYYKDDIEQVNVEGHTSSEYSLANTKEAKYEANQKLSQDRANNVLSFLKDINNPIVVKNFSWIVTTFKPVGMSSSEPVLNSDGTENRKKSRRIAFTIKIKASPDELQ